MQLNQIFLSIVKSCIFLVYLTAGEQAFRSTSLCDEIVDIEFGREDNKILYAVDHMIENNTKNEIEFHLEKPGKTTASLDKTHKFYPKDDWLILSYSPVGLDGVLVTYYNFQTNSTEFTILNLKTGKLSSIKAGLILYKDLGDIILSHDQVKLLLKSKTQCGKSETCLISFDHNGKRIGKPEPFEPVIEPFQQIGDSWKPVSPDGASKTLQGYYHESFDEHVGEFVVSYVQPNGREVASFYVPKSQWGYSATATNEGLYLACGMYYSRNLPHSKELEKTVECEQINFPNKELLQRRKMTVSKDAVSLAVINMAGGGYMFSTAMAKSPKEPSTSDKYDVIKVDAKGNINRYEPLTLNLTCGDMDGRLFASKITQDKQKFCFYFICEYIGDQNNTYHSDCFGLNKLRLKKN